MKEHHMFVHQQLIPALLDGRKTQARIPITPHPSVITIRYVMEEGCVPKGRYSGWVKECGAPFLIPIKPRYEVGDRVWVPEEWARRLDEDDLECPELKGEWAWYWADQQTQNTGCAGAAGKRRSASTMPKWAARLWLEITGVRVERVQAISHADSIAEGVDAWLETQRDTTSNLRKQPLTIKQLAFSRMWDSFYSIKGLGWDKNPWCWVYEFKRVFPNGNRIEMHSANGPSVVLSPDTIIVDDRG